ncbi:MAG: hypothetical protein HKN03_00390 [Acidimicrobiales bacterium]|nr:hypothetical protein [Acidimicrobiales bacterium]
MVVLVLPVKHRLFQRRPAGIQDFGSDEHWLGGSDGGPQPREREHRAALGQIVVGEEPSERTLPRLFVCPLERYVYRIEPGVDSMRGTAGNCSAGLIAAPPGSVHPASLCFDRQRV